MPKSRHKHRNVNKRSSRTQSSSKLPLARPPSPASLDINTSSDINRSIKFHPPPQRPSSPELSSRELRRSSRPLEITVCLVRHGPTVANKLSPVWHPLNTLSHLERKAVVDPVLTMDGLKTALYNGKKLYESYLTDKESRHNNIHYFTSLLPRTSITMLALLKGAGKLGDPHSQIKRMRYIQEKENYSITGSLGALSSSKLASVNSNEKRALWEKHMSTFPQCKDVGSSAVTNIWKSNQWVKKINQLFTEDSGRTLFVDEENIEGFDPGDPGYDEFELQIHDENDFDKFLNILEQMVNGKKIKNNDFLFIVGHGDWIQDFLKKKLERDVDKLENLECYEFNIYFTQNATGFEFHSLEMVRNKKPHPLPSNSDVVDEFITGVHSNLCRKYMSLFGFSEKKPYGTYTFASVVDPENLQSALNKHKKNPFLERCNGLKKKKTYTKEEWNPFVRSTIQTFGGKKNVKSFLKKIDGKKRRIYIGPKGGKFYIKKTKKKKLKKVYI